MPEHYRLIYMNTATGECSPEQGEVAKWFFQGDNATIVGYTAYEWVGDHVEEVWH